MITAIELCQDKRTKEPFPWQERRGLKVYQHGLKNRVLIRPLGNVIYFMPPYVISYEEIDLMLQVAMDGIAHAIRN
jgi:adenosylmethionine-8-amino-7-oxononanoate aminotransferase